MQDKRDKAYTEEEEKQAVKFVDKVIKAENDDLQKIFWIMKGMQMAREDIKVSVVRRY